MYAAEKLFVSLTLFRHDQPIWKTSPRVMHDYEVMDNIFKNHGHRISQWNDDVLSRHLLHKYADVIYAKGAPPENCFGFIDGTVRPNQQQRIV